MPPRIIVVGSINLDLVLRVPRVPIAGETLAGRSLEYVPGGKGANQAVAASRLGAHVAMVARVGEDASAAAMLRNLAENGVDVELVTPAPAPQGLAVILVDDEGRNAIVLAEGSNGHLRPEDLERAAPAFTGADVALLQNEVRPEATLAAARAAKRAGATVIWNPAPAPDDPSDAMPGVVDIIAPNEHEAEHLTGIAADDPKAAARAAAALRRKGYPISIVTLGAAGAVWASETEMLHQPAYPVEVVDTTAAGDTFLGAIAVALAEHRPPRDAIRFAAAAAALAVTKPGAQPGIPARAEVDALANGERAPLAVNLHA